MENNVLRYIVAIAQCGSISAASRKLFISQPALTKQLSRLEMQLGVKLFERRSAHLSITPAGEIFLEYAIAAIELEKQMLERLTQRGEMTGERVRVATTHRGGCFVGDHTAAFLSRFPGIRLEYLDMSAEECERALEEGTADLAVYTDPVLSEQIEYMPLEEDRLVLVLPRNSEIVAGCDLKTNSPNSPLPISADALRQSSLIWVLSTPDHSLYYAESSFFKKYRITPVQSMRVDYVDTRYAVACGGGGVMLAPVSTANRACFRETTAYCTMEDGDIYRYVVIARKKGCKMTRGMEAFWRFMIERRFQTEG